MVKAQKHTSDGGAPQVRDCIKRHCIPSESDMIVRETVLPHLLPAAKLPRFSLLLWRQLDIAMRIRIGIWVALFFSIKEE